MPNYDLIYTGDQVKQLLDDIPTKVPQTTTINGKTLSSDIIITQSDVGLENVTNESKETMFISPALTGIPTAPTPTSGDDSTQIATTAFVNAEIINDRPFEETDSNIKMDGVQSVGTLDTVARGDHVHPVDTSRASATHTHAQSDITNLTTDLAGKVPTTRTVNSKELSSNITLAQTDIGGLETVLKSASFTLALTDNYDLLKCVSASTITVTIPTNASVAFPVGSEIVIARYGAGAVTLSPASGVTLYSSDSKKSINKQYEFATLKKIATDEWVLLGSLSA